MIFALCFIMDRVRCSSQGTVWLVNIDSKSGFRPTETTIALWDALEFFDEFFQQF